MGMPADPEGLKQYLQSWGPTRADPFQHHADEQEARRRGRTRQGTRGAAHAKRVTLYNVSASRIQDQYDALWETLVELRHSLPSTCN